jgi:Fe-S cluster biogenesis protein NfuA
MAERLAELTDRIEAALARLGADGDELVAALAALYGAGLSRTLELVHEHGGERSEELFERFCEDELVAALMLAHGLHPLDVDDRVRSALERVRPYLRSHHGDVELLGIEDGIVHVKLTGTCEHCSSSSATLKLAVERAVLEAAPEVAEVRG